MIIAEKVVDLVVVGDDNSKKAKISQDKLAKLQYLLTKGLYKDPITAVIAEWTNNGIDSVVQAGKDPIETPVMVSINREPTGQYTFKVEDKGTGLDDVDFENICMNYLESTKEDDNDTIGHFGIGMKSFLSLERSATFTCRKNGIERKYLVYEGAEFVNYNLIYTKETTEESGVIAELVINGWSEKNLFADKAKTKLAYYDTVVLVIDGNIIHNEIHRNELFQWNTMYTNPTLHIALKDVYYPIDWEALGISPIRMPIAIRLNLSDGLVPTPSRESYITNEKTRKLLLSKIRELADWFANRYNKTVKNFKTFMEAFDFLGRTDFEVVIKGTHFMINGLLPHTDVKLGTPQVEGIKLKDPTEYKSKRSDLLNEYSAVGYLNNSGTLNTKPNRMGTSKDSHIFHNKGVTVLVGEDFRGNIREYLKEKWGSHTLFVKRNNWDWRLGTGKELGPNGQLKIDTQTYRYILGLATKPKNTWRDHIQEWNFVISSIVSTFKDERNVANDQVYLDWLEKKREEQRQKRKDAGNPAYNGLGKQQGDVTLGYAYERYGKIHFKKGAFPIAGLHKNTFLTVLVTSEDNEELAKGIALVLKDKKHIRFAYVGKLEKKKIPDHFQFINFQQFMTRDCKPFMRLASAIKFQELLNDYNAVSNYQNIVFRSMMKQYKRDADDLRKFCDENLINHYSLDDTLKNMIIDAADKHNLYDKTIWDKYLRLKDAVTRYDFITFMKVPSTTNHEMTSRYERLVNQILLFRKKQYNDLPEGAKIVFEKPEIKKEIHEMV